MACKRSGVRISLAPRFRSSKACCDLRRCALSACNSATCQKLASLFRLKPVHVKSVLSSRNTAVSSLSLLDGQADSQPVIRGSCLSGGDRFGAAVLSLRPVNPEDLQSRLMSEQIAEYLRLSRPTETLGTRARFSTHGGLRCQESVLY